MFTSIFKNNSKKATKLPWNCEKKTRHKTRKNMVEGWKWAQRCKTTQNKYKHEKQPQEAHESSHRTHDFTKQCFFHAETLHSDRLTEANTGDGFWLDPQRTITMTPKHMMGRPELLTHPYQQHLITPSSWWQWEERSWITWKQQEVSLWVLWTDHTWPNMEWRSQQIQPKSDGATLRETPKSRELHLRGN